MKNVLSYSFSTITIASLLLAPAVLCAQSRAYPEDFTERERRIADALKSALDLIAVQRKPAAKTVLYGINETYPHDQRVTLILAELEMHEKKWQSALDLLMTSKFEKDVDGGERYIRVGYLMTKVRRFKEAREMWDPGLVIRGGFPETTKMLPDIKTVKGLEAGWLLAFAYRANVTLTGGFDTKKMFEGVLALDPGNPLAAGDLAGRALNERQWRAALHYSELALKRCPPGSYRKIYENRRTKALAMLR